MGIESDLREITILRALAQEDEFERIKFAAIVAAAAAAFSSQSGKTAGKMVDLIFSSGVLGRSDKNENSSTFNIFDHPDLLLQALDKIEELVKNEKSS